LRTENYLPIVRLIVCIPDTTKITLEFLKFSIDNLDIMRSGSAIPQLTVPMIKEYSIPLPLLKDQHLIVRQLDALRAETQKLEAVYQKKIADLEELRKSVLEKAFSGRLTDKIETV
jgi:type I restriction enzyme S subunit